MFTVAKEARHIDFGHDFTRPRSTNYTPGSVAEDERLSHAYIFGVMTDTGRGGDATAEPNWEAEGWATTLSIPRRLTLQGGALYQTPPRGLPDAVAETERARMWTGLCEIPVGETGSVTAEIIDGEGNVAAVITHSGDEISLDRLDGAAASAPLGDDDEDNITILVDSSTIEVFAGGGAVAMSSRFWPNGGTADIRITTDGAAVVLNEWYRSASR